MRETFCSTYFASDGGFFLLAALSRDTFSLWLVVGTHSVFVVVVGGVSLNIIYINSYTMLPFLLI